MGLSFFTVVFDADNPHRVGQFWAAALERDELIEGELEEWTSLPGDPQLWFQKVPEGKTTKNRVHLDWYAPDRGAEVERLIGLGATRLRPILPIRRFCSTYTTRGAGNRDVLLTVCSRRNDTGWHRTTSDYTGR